MPKRRLHCHLCGAPFFISSTQCQTEDRDNETEPGQLLEWLNELRFIGKEEPRCSAGLRFKARSLETRLEFDYEVDELVVYQFPEGDLSGIYQIPEDCYSFRTEDDTDPDISLFPVHAKCIELLRRLKAAYNVFRNDILRVLEMDHGYAVPEEDEEAEQSIRLANPITIPHLTTYILSHLRPVADITSLHHHQQYNKRSPSPELSSSVCYANYDRRHLHTHHDDHGNIHQQQEQQIYRDKLISGSAGPYLPYLWDLDAEVCKEKDSQQSTNNGQVWDWKALVEELSRSRGVWEDAPFGWRNRCRIWESARRRFAELEYDGAVH